MALEGNLSSFGLSEILQLIAVQRKTGMLTVCNDDITAVMFFRDGMIISGRDRRRRANDPLKDYLTRYGILTREELTRISQISSKTKLDLTEILESEAIIAADELRKHFRDQIQETLLDVLTWEQCTYKFNANNSVIKGVKSLGEYNIEAMLMESMRRIDEFPLLLEIFPSDQIMVSRSGKEVENSDLTSNEKSILERLDHRLSLQDLIASAKMPLFEVYEALKLLKEKGLVEAKDERSKVTQDIEQAKNPKTIRRAPRVNPFPFALALVLLAISLFVGKRDLLTHFNAGEHFAIESLEESSVARNQMEAKIRWTLEAYRVLHGVYPTSFESLQSEGLATPRLLEKAKAFSFRYHLTPDRRAYTLL